MARTRLTRDKVIDAAVAVADAGGLFAVSMRNVGRGLGVEAMSLYHHVADKSALLDAMVDWIFTRIELPDPDDGWREGMGRRADSARAVLTAHPWALGLVDSRRTPGPGIAAPQAMRRRTGALRLNLLKGNPAKPATPWSKKAVETALYG